MELPPQISRPTEETIKAKATRILEMKDEAPIAYREIKDELKGMARGESIEGVRNEFYAGWTDEDFQTLLDQLN